MMKTCEEIIVAWNERSVHLLDWFQAMSPGNFERGPEGRWSAGQHLDHLVRSVKPLTMALRIPKVALRRLFGPADRDSVSFEVLADRYEATLRKGGKASGRFVPVFVSRGMQRELIDAFRTESERLAKTATKWSEANLDKHFLPHPLLGKLTVREMLYFTVLHTQHHYETLLRDYGE